MPIGGFVVVAVSEFLDRVVDDLKSRSCVSVYGTDDKGNIVVVIESETSEEMERLVEEIKSIDGVLNVGLAYLHFEDEVDKIERGEIKPPIGFGRRKLQ